MANPRRGEVDVELDGRTYTLAFDFNAIAEIEGAFGDRPINDIIFPDGKGVSARGLRESVRIGMQKKHRKPTVQEAGRMIQATIDSDPAALTKIAQAVIRGVLSANGATDDLLKEIKSDDSELARKEGEPEDPREAPETGTA